MDEAHAAMSTGWPADSMRQATTSTGTDQSTLTTLMSTNGRTKAARYSPLPAGSSIAKDTHMCRHVRVDVAGTGSCRLSGSAGERVPLGTESHHLPAVWAEEDESPADPERALRLAHVDLGDLFFAVGADGYEVFSPHYGTRRRCCLCTHHGLRITHLHTRQQQLSSKVMQRPPEITADMGGYTSSASSPMEPTRLCLAGTDSRRTRRIDE